MVGNILLIGLILVGTASLVAGIWILTKRLRHHKNPQSINDVKGEVTAHADKDVERIFNNDFREELRNRGRLHFEKIITENAMFLQQDLRLTTSQLNEFMKDEIRKVLKDEFSAYEESIKTAKDIAIDSIKKTQSAVEEQRNLLEKQIAEQVQVEKQVLIERFTTNMSQIISHYLVDVLGDEVALDQQMEYIFKQLEDAKADMVEDIRSAA